MNRLFGTLLVAGLGLLSACKQAYENVMLETLPRPQTPVARDYVNDADPGRLSC